MTTKRLLAGMLIPLLIILCPSLLFAQNKTITGKVTDSKDGSPLAGVSVVPRGSVKGTVTEADGTFRLVVGDNVKTLVFSNVGFGVQLVNITGDNMSVSLIAANTSLNEVVVVGYGTQRKKDLTGAVTSITAKDFVKGVNTTPEQLIVGKVAGVSITSNGGAPGAGSTIRIRGGASLSASNDPLIVIDGVPLENSSISGAANALSLINPNDIESMNILKDASATAIYGSRASNGVIIITTKKGSRGSVMRVNASTMFSVQEITKKVSVLNAADFREAVTAAGATALLGDAETDWQDQIYQTALTSDNNISVSGGIKNLPYRFSVGYLTQDGILKTSHLNRVSASLNISPTLFDNHLKIDLNLKGTLSKNTFANESAIGSAITFDPTKSVYSKSPRFGGYTEWLDPAAASGLRSLAPRNPLGLLMQQEDKSDVQRSIGNVQLDYKFHFLPDLHANLNVGYDISEGKGTKYIPDSAASSYNRSTDETKKLGNGVNTEYLQRKKNTLLEFYFNYVKDLRSIQSRIDAVAGYSYNDFETTVYNFADYFANGVKVENSTPSFAFDKPKNVLISYFGRINYSYKSKYLLTASLRRDGSSRFNPNNRWGLFPAGALAWKMSDESFLKNSRVVSDLKLRLGYGVTGQQDGIGNYDYISYFALSDQKAQYQIGNTFYSMYRPGGYYANRKWEQSTNYNVALDYGFLGNRITGSIDFYYKKTTDLLSEAAQPAGTNFSNTITANIGAMENRGIEFTVNAQPINKSDFSWDVNFNITYNKNKITNLTIQPDPKYIGVLVGGIAGGTGNTIQVHAVGYSRSSFYVYQQAYDQAGNPIEGLFADQNRDGIINEKDKVKYKSPDPRVFLGLSNSFTYKKWNGGFVLRANFGNYVYNNVYSNLGRANVLTAATGILTNLSSSYLTTRFKGVDGNQMLSDYYVQNASFLRMDNINIGYNAGRVFKGAANLRISAIAQNVFVITKYKGLDPELSNGIDYTLYPRPRTFSLGLNLDF
jgi:TonB-dependent starch-binding outer membrane protein SusC